MIRLLRLIPGWVWAVMLAAALAGGGWLYVQAIRAERDAFRAELQTARGEVAALESALEWRRENARRLLAALEQREQDLAEARNEIRGRLEALDRLEESDAEVGDWAAQPVPNAVSEWVRQLGATDGPRAGDTDGAAEPDPAPPASSDDREDQPGAAGAAR